VTDPTVSPSPAASKLEAAILNLLTKVIRIMDTQAQAVTALQTVTATLDKVKDETTGLLVEIATLKDLANQAAATLSPELAAAVQAVADRAAAIDALVPDAPAPVV
jgi:hypothetical protein